MTQIKHVIREYPDYDKKGMYVPFKVTYQLTIKNNEIVDIRNPFYTKVKETSDCWNFMNNNLKTILKSQEILTLK